MTHCLRATKDGSELLLRPESKPKGLADEKVERLFPSWSDKNEQHFLARNHQEGAKVAQERKQMSLVAGNVTGGGGKATQQKPIGIKF